MASAVGMVVGSVGNEWVGKKNGSKIGAFKCSSALTDHFKTLNVHPGASEIEVRKAFRQLALQYHPDVCKGNNCSVQFSRINEAYDIVMKNTREPEEGELINLSTQEWADDDETKGMYDSSWDLWEEWMGFEGACTADYASHVNPYL